MSDCRHEGYAEALIGLSEREKEEFVEAFGGRWEARARPFMERDGLCYWPAWMIDGEPMDLDEAYLTLRNRALHARMMEGRSDQDELVACARATVRAASLAKIAIDKK